MEECWRYTKRDPVARGSSDRCRGDILGEGAFLVARVGVYQWKVWDPKGPPVRG